MSGSTNWEQVYKVQSARIEQLECENAALREELRQSEDRFRNIPDEVWSKSDLVKRIHKTLEERDEANERNAALRADAERYRYIKNSETVEVSGILQTFCVSMTFDLDAAIDAARAKENQS